MQDVFGKEYKVLRQTFEKLSTIIISYDKNIFSQKEKIAKQSIPFTAKGNTFLYGR